MTNLEKFENVFGFRPSANTEIVNCEHYTYENCPIAPCTMCLKDNWWNREYKGWCYEKPRKIR